MESVLPIAIAILLIILGYVSLDIMGFLSWSNKFQVEGRVRPGFLPLEKLY